MSAPPFFASSLFSASSSESSPTQGLQVVNQKFTTVTALAENSSSLFTGFPSKSLPSKAGKGLLFCSMGLPFSAGTLTVPSGVSGISSGNFSSSLVS